MKLDFFEVDYERQVEMATTAGDKKAAQALFAPMIVDLVLGPNMPDDPDDYELLEMHPTYERTGKARRT